MISYLHIYLSIGGQILAKRLKKHILHLEKTDGTWDSNSGLSFYYFNNIGNQNEFKNMYRQQLDEAPVTEHLKSKTKFIYLYKVFGDFFLLIYLYSRFLFYYAHRFDC